MSDTKRGGYIESAARKSSGRVYRMDGRHKPPHGRHIGSAFRGPFQRFVNVSLTAPAVGVVDCGVAGAASVTASPAGVFVNMPGGSYRIG